MDRRLMQISVRIGDIGNGISGTTCVCYSASANADTRETVTGIALDPDTIENK